MTDTIISTPVPNIASSPSDDTTTADKDLSSESLSIKLQGGDGNEVYFKVKRKTVFAKVFKAYCSKMGVERETMRFLFDGVRVKDEDTPEKLQMNDEDIVEVMTQQTGGGGSD